MQHEFQLELGTKLFRRSLFSVIVHALHIPIDIYERNVILNQVCVNLKVCGQCENRFSVFREVLESKSN